MAQPSACLCVFNMCRLSQISFTLAVTMCLLLTKTQNNSYLLVITAENVIPKHKIQTRISMLNIFLRLRVMKLTVAI